MAGLHKALEKNRYVWWHVLCFFLLWSVACLVRLVRRKDLTGIICAAFFAAIMVYGLAEMAVVPGQITLVLMFLLYYFAIQEGAA